MGTIYTICMYTFLYGGACVDARDTSSVSPFAQLRYLFVKEVRQAGGHSAAAKCLSPCSQQARDHMTILPNTLIYPQQHLHAVQLGVLVASSVTLQLPRPVE